MFLLFNNYSTVLRTIPEFCSCKISFLSTFSYCVYYYHFFGEIQMYISSSQFRLSFVTLVHSTHSVEFFGNCAMLAMMARLCGKQRASVFSSRLLYTREYEKSQFSTYISPYLEKYTRSGQQKLVCDLSNGTIFNDLE